MSLLAIYVLLVGVGETLMYLSWLWLESMSSDLAMPIAMAVLFGVLIFAWPLANKIDHRLFPDAT